MSGCCHGSRPAVNVVSPFSGGVKSNMEIRHCHIIDLEAVVELNETVYAALPDKSVLRHNSAEMIASCLEEPNVTLGVWDGELLVAVGMLYMPQCLE